MPRARKDELSWVPGGYYHIYNRGARRLSIFREAENYLFLLRRLKHFLGGLELSVVAYCFMPNHYHVLVRQDGPHAAGLLMQRVFNSYTKAFNKRYGHSGTLFERRYLAKAITNTTHLLHLCRYIHANPVKDGFVAHPADWPYSNYLEWVGLREGTLVDREFIEAHFPKVENYRVFVMEYLKTRELPEGLKQYLVGLEGGG